MALLNVLINARDAMPQGGKVTVATSVLQDMDRIAAHHLPPGRYVVICVIDEGTGMSQEVLQRATEPFFTTKGPGTGLGLAMVHGFVQQSHGRLEIESKPDQGTIVRMIFPLAAELSTPSRQDEPQQPPNAMTGSDQTILVVEDSDDVRQVAENYLRSLGYRVLTAYSGEEALKLLDEDHKVDLLFTDIIMPGGMNGLVLAEQARQRFSGLPVLFTTGYTDELYRQGGDPSFMDILNKPYRKNELAERIHAALNQDESPVIRRSSNFRHEG